MSNELKKSMWAEPKPGGPNPAHEKFTPSQVAEALRQSAGVISGAAMMLGCSRDTVERYCKKYESLRDLITMLKEMNLDAAESQLLKKISEGETQAIVFFLKTQGKRRGYTERTELQAMLPTITTYLPETTDERALVEEQERARRLEAPVVIDAVPEAPTLAVTDPLPAPRCPQCDDENFHPETGSCPSCGYPVFEK